MCYGIKEKCITRLQFNRTALLVIQGPKISSKSNCNYLIDDFASKKVKTFFGSVEKLKIIDD